MASCTTYLAFLILCLFVCKPMTIWADLPRLFPGPTYEVNYTIAEECTVPMVLGNLVLDLGLADWMLKQSVMNNPDIHHDPTTSSPLSIDVIANAGQAHSSSLIDVTTPRLRLFPSNQWGSKYFSVHYKSILIQELVLTEFLDRELACDLVDTSSSSPEHTTSERCSCSPGVCSSINTQNQPTCAATITIALHPLQPGMAVYVVHISIQDKNDNTPRFDSPSPFEVYFKENDVLGTKRNLPTAGDNDFCDNGKVQYALIPAGFADSMESVPFHLHTMPRSHNRTHVELVLQRYLDRERRKSYDLYLLAIDQSTAEPRRTGTMNIRVIVEDVNDCRPIFDLGDIGDQSRTCVPSSESYRPTMHIRVPENKGPVPWLLKQVRAYDADTEENGDVHFQLAPRTHPCTKKYFQLNATSGEIWVVKLLDREQTPMQDGLHRLKVLAIDSGSPVRSSQLLIIVYLLDINDNAPRIRLVGESVQLTRNASAAEQMSERSRRFWKTEIIKPTFQPNDLQWPVDLSILGIEAPGQVVATLVVSDPDRGLNGTVDCRIGNQWPNTEEDSSDQHGVKDWFKLNPLLMYSDEGTRSSELEGGFLFQSLGQKSAIKYWNQTQEKAFTLDALRPINPVAVSHIFVQIICHDHGPNRLTRERTLHVGIEATIQRAGLHWSFVLLLLDSIKSSTSECTSTNRLTVFNVTEGTIYFDRQNQNSPMLCLSLDSADVLFQERWYDCKELPIFQVGAAFDHPVFQYRTTLKYQLSAANNTPDILQLYGVDAQSGRITLRCPDSAKMDITEKRHVLRIRALLTVQTAQRNVTKSVDLTIHIYLVSTLNMVLHYVRAKGGSFLLENRSVIHMSVPEGVPAGTRVTPESLFYCGKSVQPVCFTELRSIGDNIWKQPQTSQIFQTYALPESDWVVKTGVKGTPYTITTKKPLDRQIQSEYQVRLVISRFADFTESIHTRTLIIHVRENHESMPILQDLFHPSAGWPPTGLVCDIPEPLELQGEINHRIYLANVSLSNQEQKGYTIFCMQTLLRDKGLHRSLTFSLDRVFRCDGTKAVPIGLFEAVELDKTSGILRVVGELPRSSLGSYVLQIAVRRSYAKMILQAIALIQIHILEGPRFQRPVNDLPDTVSKSPFLSSQVHRSREATYTRGQEADEPEISIGVTSNPAFPTVTSSNLLRSNIFAGSPWLQRLVFISLLVVLSVVCPTILCWILYSQRWRIRRWLFSSGTPRTTGKNGATEEYQNAGTSAEKVDATLGEGFHMTEVHANPFTMDWNDLVGRMQYSSNSTGTADMVARMEEDHEQFRPNLMPADLCGQMSPESEMLKQQSMEDTDPSQIVGNTWQPLLAMGDQQSSYSVVSSSNLSIPFFPRSCRIDTTKQQRPSDSSFDLRVFHRASPVCSGSVMYHRLTPDIDPGLSCPPQPSSYQLPYLFRPRQSSLVEEIHFPANRDGDISCSSTVPEPLGTLNHPDQSPFDRSLP